MVNLQTSEPVRLRIEGMHCGGCVGKVETSLRRVPGVAEVRVSLPTESAVVYPQDGSLSSSALIEAVRAVGYDAQPVRPSTTELTGLGKSSETRLREQRQALVYAFGLAAPILALDVLSPRLHSHDPGGHLWPLAIQGIMSLVLLISPASAPILAAGLQAVLHRTGSMDLLISMGLVTAFVASAIGLILGRTDIVHFHAVAMIVPIVALGRLLELRARRQATSDITGIAGLIPQRAKIVSFDEKDKAPPAAVPSTREVPVHSVRVGDFLWVGQDTVVPVDGTIVHGNAAIDESTLTGEASPRHRGEGESVSAGTLVVDGSVTLRAERVGTDSSIGRIVRLVEEAQASRMPLQRVADAAAGRLVPVVLAATFVAFGGNLLIADVGIGEAVSRAVAVMVIACPCAMGLATPLAVLVAGGAAARRGLLVRDAAMFETAAKTKHAYFDKTGTLTLGRPTVVDVWLAPVSESTPTRGAVDASELLRLSASLEALSQHPLARAIVAHARNTLGFSPAAVSEFKSSPGLAVSGIVAGRLVEVGATRHFAARGLLDLAPFQQELRIAAERGFTSSLVAIDGKAVGIIRFEDTVRPEAAQALARLRAMRITTSVLTGDNPETAARITQLTGADQFTAELSPAGKLEIMQRERSEHASQMFVGDGVNDAPALAAADVGVAIGAGTDAAVHLAAVTLVHPNLLRVPEFITLSRRTVTIIKQNLVWAFGYNVVALPLAALGHVPPAIAAAAMMVSSISVVLNSLRLKRQGI